MAVNYFSEFSPFLKTRKVLEMGTQKKRFNNPIDRYQALTIKECLSKPSRYSFVCKELSYFLKNAYSKFPKNLQSLIFQDTLFAFSLLPEIQTQSAISASNSLLQSAEFALPKQKRALAVAEHKHAVVASKRKSKTNKEKEGLAELPRDVLVHIFGFLDVQSLLSASAVCQYFFFLCNQIDVMFFFPCIMLGIHAGNGFSFQGFFTGRGILLPVTTVYGNCYVILTFATVTMLWRTRNLELLERLKILNMRSIKLTTLQQVVLTIDFHSQQLIKMLVMENSDIIEDTVRVAVQLFG